MTNREKVIERLEYCAETRDGYVRDCINDALAMLKEDCHNCKLECLLRKYDELKEKYDALLKKQEDRHRLEVHNIGNVDIPEGVSEEHFHLVMNNVVEALQHTDKGESYPYEDTGR